MRQELLNALESLPLNVSMSNGGGGFRDVAYAKMMFNVMYANKVKLNGSEIEQWALSSGWQTRDAQELGELGEMIGAD